MNSCRARKNEQISPCRILMRSKNLGVSMVKVSVSQSEASGCGPGGSFKPLAIARLIALGIGEYSSGRGLSKGLTMGSFNDIGR